MHAVVIIGSGFGAITAAIALQKRNISDFVMLERRSFFGGTWLQNTYPGAAVDVQSPLYSVSGEPYVWSHLFAKQSELADYTESLIQKYLLDQHIKLNSEVIESRWMGSFWRLSLANGKSLEAKAVINATGPLSTPVIPKFNNMADYQGVSFHSNDWQHDVEIDGKDVAIVGSGASAVQIIPAIVDRVKSLAVVQRTPHWLLPRMDWSFPKWLARILAFRPLYTLIRWCIYWALELRVIAFKYSPFLLKLVGHYPALRHLRKQVESPQLRAKLTPDFTIGCKRIIVSNTYYPALQKDNLRLFDASDAMLGFWEGGIEFAISGKVKADVVVFATGYDAADSMISYSVIGQHNIALSQQWKDYPRAYLGTTMPNFPNFFVVTGPNTGIGHTSAIFVIESQMKYISRCIDELQKETVTSIQPSAEAEMKYTNMVHAEMQRTVWKNGGCSSWYQNKQGKVIAMFPGFSFIYRSMCKRFKKSDHLIR
ncbi:NAD(P)/FAD-dependent oxidoreductase [Glaciecola sp. MH2013]|uniref:flavin-containing monooxygenase n=1 Tax=Glaciecola sp. MH2013 TaxID=2785524 RepID=UPI001E43FE57|nr:NAD(P)/FAD-dependent oxidoreductase [Glaciecola sp. MH2013]